MHYYPTILPHVNKSKLERYKKYSSPTTMLYSNEGMFQVKSGKLYQVHFKDDENSVQKNIGKCKVICDNSYITWTPSNKLPYDFIRKDVTVNCYVNGSLKMYIEETDGKVSHLYFYVKDTNIYNIEEEIADMLELCAKS